jgi:hypothetical protein
MAFVAAVMVWFNNTDYPSEFFGKVLAAGPNLPWVAAGIPVRTTIPKAAQQMQTGVGEAIILFPDTDYKLKLHEAIKGGYYTITDFGAVTQIALTMNLRARKKLPAEVVKIIDEEAKKVPHTIFDCFSKRSFMGHRKAESCWN